MTRTIEIRNVPDTLLRQLEARATLAGLSLSDFLLAELRRIVLPLSPGESRARLAFRTSVEPKENPADAVRRERDHH